MKILLVEDDIEISDMLKNFLMTENFEVVAAFDGESACREFFADEYSLVLLDLIIPKKKRNGSYEGNQRKKYGAYHYHIG